MSLQSKQASSIFPTPLFVSKLASLSIAAATIIPEAIALLFLVGICLFSNQLVTSMGESAFTAISTKTFDLKGSAQLSLVFKGRGAAAAIAGRLSFWVGGGLRCIEVLIHELIHLISIYLNDIISKSLIIWDFKSVENHRSRNISKIEVIKLSVHTNGWKFIRFWSGIYIE